MTEDEEREIIDWFAAMLNDARNGLSFVMGWADILLNPETGSLSDEQREGIEGIRNGGLQSLNMLNRYWLYVSHRYRARRDNPRWQPISLRSEFEEAVSAVCKFNPELNATLEIPSDMPLVRAEDYTLRWLIETLLDSELNNNRPVIIRAVTREDNVLVEIVDQARNLGHIIEKPYYAGTPLAIAELLLRRLESQLTVETTVNETIFRFQLPVSDGNANSIQGQP